MLGALFSCVWGFNHCCGYEANAFPSKENGKTNYINKIDRSTLSWRGAEEPSGGWSKGALTTTLCQFIEFFSKLHDLEQSLDERLRLIVAEHWFYYVLVAWFPIIGWYMLGLVWLSGITYFSVWMGNHHKASASRALNYWMSNLFKNNFWIASAHAKRLNSACEHFLLAYSRLALLSYRLNEQRFGINPKLHMLWHVWRWMRDQANNCPWVENPMAQSCASDEDFIGRYCLLTRCVNPRSRILRSLQRYLTQVLLIWMHLKRKGWRTLGLEKAWEPVLTCKPVGTRGEV